MSKERKLIGKRFGRLTVIRKDYKPKGSSGYRYYWICKCDCGNIKSVRSDQLRENSTTISCGCYNKELSSKKLAEATRTHGMSSTKLYTMWRDMRHRCYSKKTDRYENYGGRGIEVCNDWNEKFESFMEWAFNNGYKEGLSIDRIDVNGNYEPSNCRFVTIKEQYRNKTNNVFVEYEGRKICIQELSEITGINAKRIYARYYRGDRGERLWRKERERKKSIPR